MWATTTPSGDVGHLVYNEAADVTLGIPSWKGPVRAYSALFDTWTELPARGQVPMGISDAVYDPDTETDFGWSDQTTGLWAYDLSELAWTPVARHTGHPWPDTTSSTLGSWTGYTLMTYDTLRDAVLFAVFPADGRVGSTWSFDVGSEEWTDLGTVPPNMQFGYAERGGEITYDSTHGQAVVAGFGTVALFDSRSGLWMRPSPQDPSSEYLVRDGHTLVFDPINDRVVMLGGIALVTDQRLPSDYQVNWSLPADTWAYDVAGNSWAQLVPQQYPPVLSGTYPPPDWD